MKHHYTINNRTVTRSEAVAALEAEGADAGVRVDGIDVGSVSEAHMTSQAAHPYTIKDAIKDVQTLEIRIWTLATAAHVAIKNGDEDRGGKLAFEMSYLCERQYFLLTIIYPHGVPSGF